jgi:hypothetical protein
MLLDRHNEDSLGCCIFDQGLVQGLDRGHVDDACFHAIPSEIFRSG